MADNINCFPGLRQLSAPQQRNTLKLNTAKFSSLFNTEAFSALLCIRAIWGFQEMLLSVIVVHLWYNKCSFTTHQWVLMISISMSDLSLPSGAVKPL